MAAVRSRTALHSRIRPAHGHHWKVVILPRDGAAGPLRVELGPHPEMRMPAETPRDIVTAALLVIGDEILSGRTKDKNIGYIAEYLTNVGIDLREVRVVPDVEQEIVAALDALRRRYTYVFTTGGIGPTHDDITADSVAKAFGVGIDHHPEVVARFRERWSEQDLNEA